MADYLKCAECGRYIYMGEGFYQVGWKAYCNNCCKHRHTLFDEWEKKRMSESKEIDLDELHPIFKEE